MPENNEITLPVDGLVDTKAIIKYLGISSSMWSKLQKSGKVQAPIKIGTSARWPAEYVRKIGNEGIPA